MSPLGNWVLYALATGTYQTAPRWKEQSAMWRLGKSDSLPSLRPRL